MFVQGKRVERRPTIEAMRELRIPLRIVCYQDDGRWLAHCLEFDLLGDGDTREEALKSLNDAICTQAESSLRYGNPATLFSPADGRLFQMFAAGKDVAAGELSLHLKMVDIQRVELREYVPEPGDNLVCAHA